MTGEDRTVQVPVSLIERVTAVCERLTARITDQRDVDAVSDLRALLSHPTPTAEPVLPARAVAAVMDTYDNGDGECEPEDRWRLFRDMRSLLASEQVVVPAPAEPPRIEDMAPGTTFTADDATGGRTSGWRKEPDGWYSRVVNGGRNVSPEPPIDPSTIRDVTPPHV